MDLIYIWYHDIYWSKVFIRTINSNPDDSFTIAHSNLFLSLYKILAIAPENKYLRNYFLFYHEIVCCVYSSELPHYYVEDQKYFPTLSPDLLPDLAQWFTLNGLNYPYLEQISMVPNMFESLRFYCIVLVHIRSTLAGPFNWVTTTYVLVEK